MKHCPQRMRPGERNGRTTERLKTTKRTRVAESDGCQENGESATPMLRGRELPKVQGSPGGQTGRVLLRSESRLGTAELARRQLRGRKEGVCRWWIETST